MKKFKLNLPEWVFLDENSHLHAADEIRTLLLHIPTLTVVEVFYTDQVELKEDVQCVEFDIYTGERITAAVWDSKLVDDYELQEILAKLVVFYNDYSRWEDRNMLDTDKSKLN